MHTGDPPVSDLTAAVERHPVIHCRLAANAKLLGLLGDDVSQFGVAQQGLRRDAADIEADPAPILVFDDGGVQPELSGANRRNISAGAGSENDEVIGVIVNLTSGEGHSKYLRHLAAARVVLADTQDFGAGGYGISSLGRGCAK